MKSSDEVGYYCTICQTYLASAKNKKRHEKSHKFCTLCFKVRSRNGHNCDPNAAQLTWITLFDPTGRVLGYVPGITPASLAEHNNKEIEAQKLESLLETALDDADDGRGGN